MSTDTAFALGLLALVGPRFPDRLRAFMLTVVVVDDILALVVIATVYTEQVSAPALVAAFGLFGAVLVARALGVRVGLVYFALGVAAIWVALLESGSSRWWSGSRWAPGLRVPSRARARTGNRALPRVPRAADPGARPLGRHRPQGGLAQRERSSSSTTPGRATSSFPCSRSRTQASQSMAASSPRPSPITLGSSSATSSASPSAFSAARGCSHGSAAVGCGLRSAGWLSPAAAIAGIGFTIALLVAALAFEGQQLEEAKLGILSAAVGAALVTWLLFRATALLPRSMRIRGLLGTAESLADLYIEVDPSATTFEADRRSVTVVEYGDFQCPYCGLAEPVVRELLREFGDVLRLAAPAAERRPP